MSSRHLSIVQRSKWRNVDSTSYHVRHVVVPLEDETHLFVSPCVHGGDSEGAGKAGVKAWWREIGGRQACLSHPLAPYPTTPDTPHHVLPPIFRRGLQIVCFSTSTSSLSPGTLDLHCMVYTVHLKHTSLDVGPHCLHPSCTCLSSFAATIHSLYVPSHFSVSPPSDRRTPV